MRTTGEGYFDGVIKKNLKRNGDYFYFNPRFLTLLNLIRIFSSVPQFAFSLHLLL